MATAQNAKKACQEKLAILFYPHSLYKHFIYSSPDKNASIKHISQVDSRIVIKMRQFKSRKYPFCWSAQQNPICYTGMFKTKSNYIWILSMYDRVKKNMIKRDVWHNLTLLGSHSSKVEFYPQINVFNETKQSFFSRITEIAASTWTSSFITPDLWKYG